MRSRALSAITVIACVMALAVEGFAIARPDAKQKSAFSNRAVSNQEKAEIPPGPCGWFAPENCVTPPPLEGCTRERTDEIDERSTNYRYADFLGEPTGDYVEIDSGCKRDFEGGTIYVSYPGSQSKLLSGPIRDLYLLLGETSSDLGWPQSSEPLRVDASVRLPITVLEAVGSDVGVLEHRFQFANGWVYWRPDYLNPHIVMNRVHDLFQVEGGTPELGFPRNNTGVDSHEGDVLFQAFDRALVFENALGELEIFRDEMLDAYLDAASESRDGDPIDGPLDAETELGLPRSDYLPTPNGSVRLLHRGTIYYRRGEALQIFPAFIAMLDGRVVHWEEDAASDFTADEMVLAIEQDPYLADYRKDVLFEAFSHHGLCGDAARDSVGTRSDEYCSEFVREIYIAAGVDAGLCGRRACLWAVTYAPQLRRIFQGNDNWVYAIDAELLTPEPGDYLSMWDQGHSALVVAPSIDGRHLWRIGGNEDDAQCVVFSRSSFFDEAGVINAADLYGFGSLHPSFFD
jgi:hypothetical protein